MNLVRIGAYALLLTFTTAAAIAEQAAPDTGVGQQLRTLIDSKQHPYLRQGNFANRFDDLDVLYKSNDYGLIWSGRDGLSKSAAEVIELLRNASVQGLSAQDYDADTLSNKYRAALALPVAAHSEFVQFDTGLSIALLRYLHDLHYGRVNPQGLKFNLQLRDKKTLDLPALIKDSLKLGALAKIDLLAEPKIAQYQKLKAALSAYRALMGQTSPPYLSLKGKLRLGDSHPQLGDLAKYLVVTGDYTGALPKANADSSFSYSPELQTAVKKFQRRHGLEADGTLGASTVEALNTPPSYRLRQIELAMERLRWLPDLPASGKTVIVNIPAFQLWAIDGVGSPNPAVTNMRVVVGKALKNQTPVLMANMSFIEFNPYWNVPKNILKDELLPKLGRNPRFLASQNMEIVSGYGNTAKSEAFSGDAIEKLKKGTLRVRQRPGAKNSLGKVKFIFPNKDDVYLHDTPSTSLFSRTRRDFSHGCVRVENPKALAEFALKDQGKWNAESIQKAMRGSVNQRVDLQQPIPVLFFYTTAFVNQAGELEFFPDIYGRDNELVEALKTNIDLSDQTIFVSTNESNQEPKPTP